MRPHGGFDLVLSHCNHLLGEEDRGMEEAAEEEEDRGGRGEGGEELGPLQELVTRGGGVHGGERGCGSAARLQVSDALPPPGVRVKI